MSAISAEYAMMQKEIREAFTSYVEVFMNLWTAYDLNTLGLLSDAEYKERRNRLEHISAAYISIGIEIIDTLNLILRIDTLIEPFKDDPKHRIIVDNWISEKHTCETWLAKNQNLLEQAKSQLAMHRAIGMIQAFEQKKQRGSILGSSKDLINKIMGRKGKEERQTEELAKDIDMSELPDPEATFREEAAKSKEEEQ